MDLVYASLGWQGGTVHQVCREIERLRSVEAAARNLMNQLAFRAGCGGLRFNAVDERALSALGKVIVKAE